jgi:DNA-binding CsgD family transcriptional regulator
MDDSDADVAAIMAVLRAETGAWLRRDFAAMAQHWVHSPKTRRMTALASLGTHVDEGWEAIASRMELSMERFSTPFVVDERIRWERVNATVIGDMAWVSYDQVGTDTGDDFEMPGVNHELKIFHRIDGVWKIGCLVMMGRTFEHESGPLIEVDADRKVLWMNLPARERIRNHPALLVAAGHLRARRHQCDAALGDALRWAFHELRFHAPPSGATRPARPVILGENDAAGPLYCWVVLEDGKALVSFDNVLLVSRRIEQAATIYGLSPAQVRLARLIVAGHDLAAASEILDVSINTLRTHLQRMFDRTGARGQAALVGALLSAEAPTK